MPDADEQLLAALLTERLPRRERCGSCYCFEPDHEGSQEGACAAEVPPWGGCSINDCCTSWEPRIQEEKEEALWYIDYL